MTGNLLSFDFISNSRYITSEVSLTARSFFEKKGYEVVKIQKYKANRLELTSFVMRKLLNYK